MKKRKIFVRKLGKSIKEAELKQYFSKYGEVETVEVLRNFKTQQSRRVAYVIFRFVSSVERVFQQNRPHELMGREIECERCLLAEEINPLKTPSIGNNSTAYSSNLSLISNQENGYFIMQPNLISPNYPIINSQNQHNPFSNPIRISPNIIPSAPNHPVYQYTNPQARSVIAENNINVNLQQHFDMANTAPVNENAYNKMQTPKKAIDKIAAFKKHLKQHKNKSIRFLGKNDKTNQRDNNFTKDKDTLISHLKSTDISQKSKNLQNSIFSYRENIKKRKEIKQIEKSIGVMVNEAKPIYKLTEDEETIDKVEYNADANSIINPSVIIRKLSNTKFKEDIIDSHNKSFFSSEISKCEKISENNICSTKMDDNSKIIINSKDLIVDSIFFNNPSNIEKSIRDSESISSSEETLDLQINFSDETIDLKDKNDKDKE